MPDMTKHAVSADLPKLADTLAHAFRDDPMMAWLYRDDATRHERITEFMGLTLDVGLSRGHTYHVGDKHGVAVWCPPDVKLFDDVSGPRFAQVLNEQLGERAPEVLQALLGILAHHPEDQPYFYLSTLGVHIEHQGRGLGADLMAPMLRTCDEQGWLTYLESSNIRNVPFYERHGFRVIEEVKVSEDGPIIRPMRRECR